MVHTDVHSAANDVIIPIDAPENVRTRKKTNPPNLPSEGGRGHADQSNGFGDRINALIVCMHGIANDTDTAGSDIKNVRMR